MSDLRANKLTTIDRVSTGPDKKWLFSTPVAAAFLGSAAIWGSTWIVIKDQLATTPPTWSIAYRLAIAAMALYVLARATRRSIKLDCRGHGLAALFGFFQFFLNFNFVYYAETSITSGVVALAFALLFVPNSLLSRLLLGERYSAGYIVGSAAAVLGVALLFVEEQRVRTLPVDEFAVGASLTILAVLAASLSNIVQVSNAMKAYPVLRVVVWGLIYGAAMNIALALGLHGPPRAELRVGYWLGLLYLGIAGSAVTFTLYFFVLRSIGAGRAAYVAVLVPIVALGLSIAFEGYRWTGFSALGSALALSGLILALTSKRGDRQSRSPDPNPPKAWRSSGKVKQKETA